jgi:glutamate transport system permease protein
MQNARVLISNYDALLSVYLIVAVIYILINYLLNRVSQAVSGRRKRSAQQSRQSEDVTLDQILGSE